ncbi:MAG: flippase [Paludibacteraceae bacterium]|nr:flippase [Paludibacteraceae bacterium]MBQ6766334.1 flippase [Paludibacteraceae bacterium]MDY6374214.1 flippase [Bacteroidales bacterium]MDY6426514.1 flippase [Bacteroidales bacterium]
MYLGVKGFIKDNSHEVKDVLYLVILQGLTYVVPLLVLPYLMETLGPEKYGYIGFSVAAIQYMMLIVDFGFNQSATKRIALAKDNQEELNKIFSATVYAKLFLLTICFAIVVALSFVPQFKVYSSTLYVMFLTVVGQAFLFVFLFQGLGQIKWISIINAIAKISILPFTFLIVKHEDDYLLAALIQSMVSVVAAVISLIMVYKKHWVKLLPINTALIKNEIKESFPLFISTAATSMYTALFAIILGYISNPYEVGIYTSSDRLIRALCYMLMVPVLQVFYPYISRLAVTNKEDAIQLFNKLLIFSFASMSIFSILTFFGGPYAISFLREDFKDSGIILQIMSILPVAIGIGGVAGQFGLLAIGGQKEKIIFRNIYVIAAVVALISVTILSIYLGAEGAAIAIVIVESMVCVLMCIYALKTTSQLQKTALT